MREDESERTVQVVPFVPAYGDEVVDLIVGIQRGEFAIDRAWVFASSGVAAPVTVISTNFVAPSPSRTT